MIRKVRQSILLFILLSLFFHFGVVVVVSIKPSPPPIPHKETVEVEYIEPEPVAQEVEKLEKKKKVIEEQIVEQQKQLNDELDPTATKLSAFNQRVIQETRAKESGKFNNTAKGGKPDEGRKDGEKKEKAEKEAEKVREPGELPSLNDLVPKYSENSEPAPESEQVGEASQTDDYLKEVKTGMQTLLNTREFVYFSYYQRIKDQIRQHWEPGVREKVKVIYRQGRTIASSKDRLTQVLVVLDKQGSLIRVEILTSSGVQQLDDAATEAFRAAAPFPNPPDGMVEEDGTIKIRWDFILEA